MEGAGLSRERRDQIRTRLREVIEEMAALERELDTGEEDGEQETPEQRRRGFIIYPGGLAGLAVALLATPRAWAAHHGRPLAAGVVGAAGGAAITAAVITHPATTPHRAGPPPTPIRPVPTATATLTPGPQHTLPRQRRTTLPPPVIVPTRRRTPSTPSVAPSGTAPGPSPSLVPPPSPTPARKTPPPQPSPTCLVLLDLPAPTPILTVCL